MILRRNAANQSVLLGPVGTAGAVVTVNGVAGTGALTHLSDGVWQYTFSQSETDSPILRVIITTAGKIIPYNFATIKLSAAGSIEQVESVVDVTGDVSAMTAMIETIATDVFTKLAGARSTLLSGPVAAGGPIEQIKTVDLSYTIPITVPSTSELLWFMRSDPDAPNAYLIASKSVGLTQLLTNTSPTANQASVVRNANNVIVTVKAAALSQLPSETVVCELRERTQTGEEMSLHEVEITLRHSAGRN